MLRVVKVVSTAKSLALPVLTPMFTKILNTIPNVDAEFVKPEQLSEINWNGVDALWNIGFFFDVDCFFDWIKAYWPHIKTINTWVGSDILTAMEWFQERPKCYRCATRSIDIHVADGLNLQQELKQNLGLDSFYVPSVPDPMPLSIINNNSRVAVYAPTNRKSFYRHNVAVEVAHRESGFYFDFYSMFPETDPPKLPNYCFKGFLQGEEKLQAFKDDAYLIMLPQHGSVSMMMIEFMQMGRRVITNIDVPYAYLVEEPVTPEAVWTQLHKASTDTWNKGPDKEASEYYHKEYSFDKVKTCVEPIIKEKS